MVEAQLCRRRGRQLDHRHQRRS